MLIMPNRSIQSVATPSVLDCNKAHTKSTLMCVCIRVDIEYVYTDENTQRFGVVCVRAGAIQSFPDDW